MHPTPACVTVTVTPATVSVPVLGIEDVLPVTPKVTVPLPVPLLPDEIVIHETLAFAVQAHPGVAVTATEFVEVPAAALTVVGEAE